MTQESEQCPTNDFQEGESNGKCWGDGHYRCKECVHYRKDFKEHCQEYIDFVHQSQSGIKLTVL